MKFPGIFSHRLFAAALSAAAIAGPAASAGAAGVFNITTHHYNAGRTGWNSVESVLTPTAVINNNFGILATVQVDEQVDAQPLLVGSVQIVGQSAKHNVLYVATENNTIYAIEANTGQILLSRNLGIPVSLATTGYCTNNSGSIGIGSTPVINTSTGTMYVITDTLEAGVPVFRLHALKITDLTDAHASVVINPSHTLTDATTYSFNPYVTRQRSALLIANGNVYAGFASYCDFNADQSRGWVLGWNSGTLAPLTANEMPNIFATSKDDFFLTSIWMSGAGVAADSLGMIWFVTGNSDPAGKSFSKSRNLTESAVRVSADLSKLEKYFTPFDWSNLDQEDADFGSGGIMMVPNQGSGPSMAVAAGKDGNMFLMQLGAPGSLVVGGPNAVLDTQDIGGCWCAESYFTGSDNINRIVSSGGNAVQTWQIVLNPSPHLVADSWTQFLPDNGQDGGFFTTVSSNAKQNAIIWAVGRPDGNDNNAVYLDAYDPNNNGNQLVNDLIVGYWPNTQGNANIVPVVSNGKVYVASFGQVVILGLNATGTVVPLAKNRLAKPVGTAQTPAMHTLYGTIQSFNSPMIKLKTRTGSIATVDASEAITEHRMTPSAENIVVLGSYHPSGVLHAVSIGRAKNDPASWGPDR